MTERSLSKHGLRWIVLLVAAFGAFALPQGDGVLWAVAGAVIAADGPWRSFFPLLTLTIVTELVGGLGIGALSLPYAVTALIIAGSMRFLMLGPWPIVERWHVGPALRAWSVATASGMLMAVISAVVSVPLYGYGIRSVLSVLNLELIAFLICSTALALLVLRRIDMPFRFPVSFGT